MEFDQRPDADLVRVGQEAATDGNTFFVGDASQVASGATPLLQGQEIDVNELAIQVEISALGLPDDSPQLKLLQKTPGRSEETATLRIEIGSGVYEDMEYIDIREPLGQLIKDTKRTVMSSGIEYVLVKRGNQTAYFLRLRGAGDEQEDVGRESDVSSGDDEAERGEIWVPEEVYQKRLEEYRRLNWRGRERAEEMIGELIRRDMAHAYWVDAPAKKDHERLAMTLKQIDLVFSNNKSKLRVAGVDNVGPNGETGYYAHLVDEDVVQEELKTFQQKLFEALMVASETSEEDESLPALVTNENIKERTKARLNAERRGILLSPDRISEFQRDIGYSGIETACSCLTLDDDSAQAIKSSEPYIRFTRMSKSTYRIIKLSLGETNLLNYQIELLPPENERAADMLFWRSFSGVVDNLWVRGPEFKVPRNIDVKLSRALDVVRRLKDEGWTKEQVKSVVARHFGVEDLLAEELQQQTEEN